MIDRDDKLYKELRKYTCKTMLLSLVLFIFGTVVLLTSGYITLYMDIRDDYKVIIDLTSTIVISMMLYISYINYNLRQHMLYLYNAYVLSNDDESKKKFLLYLETLFVIYDLKKLRNLVKDEYNRYLDSNRDKK